ncbi:OLC1v1005179C1 [Oldenlandia corymbosa var. corymbosa]|uniref:OLC1v1005179C1 n=1 Tax=Oldenlandia corymbosa var. corymbosa TaxID=529605 RepID=A0AAV1DFB6_OLDCO|nr:OLC1v1005179C1 [Oldenlandia corymbosa var. corymbosa]
MGNASARENGGGSSGAGGGGGGGDGMQGTEVLSNGGANPAPQPHALTVRVGSADLMMNSPPRSPRRFDAAPLMFNPQVPAVPLRGDNPPFFHQMQRDEIPEAGGQQFERGIPTLITWSHGGNDVAVEGSWDNWSSRKRLQRSGKDHAILLVLPSGIYRYKFIVDGHVRYIQDLPCEADHMGQVCNILDVQDFIPENCEGVKEFETPQSPDSSYSHTLLGDEDFAKDPLVVPPQLQLTVLDTERIDGVASSSSPQRPQHVVLDHLFIEKGWASESVLALGLTHRFEQKYVTVVLYKPFKR